MSAQSTLADYTAKMKAEPDKWLGELVLYSVSDVVLPYADLEEYLQAAGLGRHVPHKPSAVDVFRRVSSSSLGGNRKRREIGPGLFVNLKLVDVVSDDVEVVRRLVCETVDQSARVLDYTEAYDITFEKATEAITVTRRGQTPHPAVDDIASEIAEDCRRLKDTVDGGCVRTVIGRVLDAASATSMRAGGGSYFVDRSEADVVAGLEDFATHVEGTMVHAVPLPDDSKQRAKVASAFEDQAKTAIERQMAEIADLLRRQSAGEEITAHKVASHLRRHRGISEDAARYAELLETTLDGTRSALHVLELQMAQLTGVGTPLKRSSAA